MAGKPSLQFYPGDWMKDPALSMCGPLTRGIWIDFLCAIHEYDHAGQITGTAEQLARVCRCSVVDLRVALGELKQTHTADVTEDGDEITVTCRRMRREWIKTTRTYRRQDIADHYAEYFRKIGERDGYCCARCFDRSDLQIDHIKPLAKGGTNKLGNLQLLCGPCNRLKGTQTIDYRRAGGGK